MNDNRFFFFNSAIRSILKEQPNSDSAKTIQFILESTFEKSWSIGLTKYLNRIPSQFKTVACVPRVTNYPRPPADAP